MPPMLLRHRLRSFLLLLLLGWLCACGGPAPEAGAQREVVLELRGLDCDGCARTVHNALVGVRGVSRAEVDHETLRARVTCSERTEVEALVSAVRGAGPNFAARALSE